MILAKTLDLTRIAAIAGLAVVATEGYACAEDISFLCAAALRPAMQELIPEFQKTSSHNIKVEYANIGVITERVRRGDEADLAIVSPQQWESLQKTGRISAGPRFVIAQVGIGALVRKGASRPNIRSVDDFKRAMLDAQSIVIGNADQGSPEGIYLIALFDRLGISDKIKSKLQLSPAIPGRVAETVIKGDAEIGFIQMSEIITSPDMDLVGPLPAEIQHVTIFTAAIPLSAKQGPAAKDLVNFLRSPRAVSVFTSNGLGPG